MTGVQTCALPISDGIGGYPKQFSNIVAATSFLEKLNGGINRPFGALGGGVNSATLKNQSDGLVANSKFLTDLLESGAFRSHGLSGIDAPTQRMVLARVIAVLKDRKILDSVIKSVPVDMVDMLRTEQLTPEMLLHDKAMLFKLNIPVGNNSVSVSVDAAGAVVAATARQAAKHILVPFYDAGGFFDIGPAVITGRKHGELQAGKEHITEIGRASCRERV